MPRGGFLILKAKIIRDSKKSLSSSYSMSVVPDVPSSQSPIWEPELSEPPPSRWKRLLAYVIPWLTIAQESVKGTGVPGLEAVISGPLKILNMVEVGLND